MRYDAGTHCARAALLAEGAALAKCPLVRGQFLAHAIIAGALARLAGEQAMRKPCTFIHVAGHGDRAGANPAWRL